jgi:hypothetical protein
MPLIPALTFTMFSIIGVPYLESHYGSFSIGALNTYWIFALIHLARLILPIAQHINQRQDDIEFCFIMTTRETQLLLYFMPWWIAREAVMLVWLLRWSIIAGFAAVVCRFTIFASTITDTELICARWTLLRLQDLLCSWCTPLFSIRGVYMRIYESSSFSVYKNNIRYARQNRNVHVEEVGKKSCSMCYEYLELEARHIRLLQIKRRQWQTQTQELEVQLIHYPLEKTPPYEALSYRWGGETPAIPLKIGDNHILINSTVEEFLFFYRSPFESDYISPFKSKYIWIDAVCINQDPKSKEIPTQIPLMMEIYQRARRVNVWLAPPKRLETVALIRGMMVEQLLLRIDRNSVRSAYSDLVESLDRAEQNHTDLAYQELAFLLTRPWFNRKWVIQETAIARQVCIFYGGASFSWKQFVEFNDAITNNPGLEIRLQTAIFKQCNASGSILKDDEGELQARKKIVILDCIRENTQLNIRLKLPLLLDQTAGFLCKKPKDKIFAIMGLLEPKALQELNLSYTKPLKTTCQEVAKYLLHTDDWFELLRISALYFEPRSTIEKNGCEKKLPSWMIDFRLSLPAGINSMSRSGNYDTREARDWDARAILDPNPDVIKVECKIDSTVQIVTRNLIMEDYVTQLRTAEGPELRTTSTEFAGEFWDWYTEVRQLTRNLPVFAAKQESSNDHEAADKHFWDACWRNVTDSSDGYLYPSETILPRSREARKIFEFWACPHNSADKINDYLLGMIDIYHFFAQHFSASYSRQRFCATSNGSLAIVPRCVEPGDFIAYVRGGYVPMVFRRINSCLEKAEIVGLCYIHGAPDIYRGYDWKDLFLE